MLLHEVSTLNLVILAKHSWGDYLRFNDRGRCSRHGETIERSGTVTVIFNDGTSDADAVPLSFLGRGDWTNGGAWSVRAVIGGDLRVWMLNVSNIRREGDWLSWFSGRLRGREVLEDGARC